MDTYVIPNVLAGALHDLLAWGVQQQVWSWLYGETALGTTLAALPPLTTTLDAGWADWSPGRAFGPHAELRWWAQDDGRYRLRLLHDAGPLPPGQVWGDGQVWVAWGSPLPTLLHGTLDTGRTAESGQASWSEARIPRYLVYPVDGDLETIPPDAVVRVTLTVQAYAQDGIVGLTRLCALATQTMPAGE